jgi:hypothetical protein
MKVIKESKASYLEVAYRAIDRDAMDLWVKKILVQVEKTSDENVILSLIQAKNPGCDIEIIGFTGLRVRKETTYYEECPVIVDIEEEYIPG